MADTPEDEAALDADAKAYRTDDLVKRLRDGGETCGADACKIKDARNGCLCAIAADEIERWRKEAHGWAEAAAQSVQSSLTLTQENERLRAALRELIQACDDGRQMPKPGPCGMTIEANIRHTWINKVEAWAVEEARAALAGEKKDD